MQEVEVEVISWWSLGVTLVRVTSQGCPQPMQWASEKAFWTAPPSYVILPCLRWLCHDAGNWLLWELEWFIWGNQEALGPPASLWQWRYLGRVLKNPITDASQFYFLLGKKMSSLPFISCLHPFQPDSCRRWLVYLAERCSFENWSEEFLLASISGPVRKLWTVLFLPQSLKTAVIDFIEKIPMN